jgi:hypothetical protein
MPYDHWAESKEEKSQYYTTNENPLEKVENHFSKWFVRAHSCTKSYDFKIMTLLFVSYFDGEIEDWSRRYLRRCSPHT